MSNKLTATALATLALATPSLLAPSAADARPKRTWLKKCGPINAKEKDVKVFYKHGPFVFYSEDTNPDYYDPWYRACNMKVGRGMVLSTSRKPTNVIFRDLSVSYRAHFCDGPRDEQRGRSYYRDMRHSLKRNRVLSTGPVVYTGETCITDEDHN